MKKPNILFICTDQQRFDSLGCYGASWVDTPNLDRLASQGVLFENCYVNNPICTPSRASIFTGKHLPGHGVYKLHDILPREEILFTERLKEEGYTTALFGKLHVSGRLYEEAQRHPHDGFDTYQWCMEASISMNSPFNGYARWLKEKDYQFYSRLKRERRKLLHIPVEYHMTHWAAERTINFIENSDPEKPFFCMMSVFDPHNPYDDYPLEMEKHVRVDEIPEPLLEPSEHLHGGNIGHSEPYAIRQERVHSYLGAFKNYSHEEIMEMRKGYFASIALIDIEVGRVIDALERKGILDDTLILFTSDHGDMLGDHSLFVKGAYFYDPAVKVPLIVFKKGLFEGGKRIDQVVQPNDIAATVCSMAGIPEDTLKAKVPESMPLQKAIAGERLHDYAICAYRNSGINDMGDSWDPPLNGTMIFDGRYKLNIFHEVEATGFSKGEGKIPASGQLFDLKEDPEETKNLYYQASYTDVKERFLEAMIQWLFKQESLLGSRGGEAKPSENQKIKNTLK